MSVLITASALAREIQTNPNLVLIDGTYGQPVSYTLPNARHFDIDAIADPDNPMPHMIPTAQDFESHIQKMGINADADIVVFDRTGFWMAAARVWWMFRLFGHDNIRILDGGLTQWTGDLTPYTDYTGQAGDFKATFHPRLYKSYTDIANNNDVFTLIDTRPAQAYAAGHIPNAQSIPLLTLITSSGCLRPHKELQAILAPYLGNNIALAAMCGSGVTACALALAFYECGREDIAVYDGSWCEWAARQDTAKTCNWSNAVGS